MEIKATFLDPKSSAYLDMMRRYFASRQGGK